MLKWSFGKPLKLQSAELFFCVHSVSDILESKGTSVVLWRNSCSLLQTVIHAPNWLDRKTACSRFFCKISSSFYSRKVLCLIFLVLLSLSKYNPFASLGGIFPSEIFSCFFLWFLEDMFYWLSSSNLKPDEDTLLHFSMPTEFIVPGNFYNECEEIVNLSSFFFFSSPFFFPLWLLAGKRRWEICF